MTPKGRNGPVEQMRVLMVARRSARQQRIQSLNQLRHLVFTAPEEIRVRFKGRYKTSLLYLTQYRFYCKAIARKICMVVIKLDLFS